jgi:hypothetical protein
MDVLPEVLRFADGGVVDRAGWPRRREEIARLLLEHEYGGMPAKCDGVEVVLRSPRSPVRTWPFGVYAVYGVRVVFAGRGEVNFTLKVWAPEGDGPFPVVLDGDGCWRYFTEDVARTIVGRGYIAATFDRTEAAADNKDAYRATGLYRLFPEAKYGALPVWAWAYHRMVDALSTLPAVKRDAIAITGHSRGGKTVLLAGATDERIALTNPNNSGIGGAGLHRLKGKRSERVDGFYESGNIFWFGQGFKDLRNRDGDFPYDQHWLHALVAPRMLLVTDAYGDHEANPPGTYAGLQASRKVWELLGAAGKIGWVFREGVHAHQLVDYETLLDFMDMQWRGKEVRREFQRELFAGLEGMLERV